MSLRPPTQGTPSTPSLEATLLADIAGVMDDAASAEASAAAATSNVAALTTTVATKVDKTKQPINVKDSPYNAAGDGAADDTTALQAAFDAGLAAARAVFIPEGTYKITAALVAPNTIRIFGEGRWQSIISQATSNTPILKSTDAASHSVCLEDLALVYATQQTNASHPNSYGIAWSSTVASPGQSNVFYWTMRRLRIANATVGIGVFTSGDTRLTMYTWNNVYEQILFQAISHTLIYNGDRSNPVNTFKAITHVGASTSAQTGPALKLQGEWKIDGLDVEDWTGQLVLADGGAGLPGTLQNVHIERHTITQASAQTLISLVNGKYVVKGVYYAAFTTATNFAHKLIKTNTASLEYGNITVGDWGATGTLTITDGAATDSHVCTGGLNANQDAGVNNTTAALSVQTEDGAIQATSAISAAYGTANRVTSGDVGGGVAGVAWGSAFDTHLKRTAAGFLTITNGFTFPAITAASAPNNTLFKDSADGKLKFKDNGGTTNALY